MCADYFAKVCNTRKIFFANETINAEKLLLLHLQHEAVCV